MIFGESDLFDMFRRSARDCGEDRRQGDGFGGGYEGYGWFRFEPCGESGEYGHFKFEPRDSGGFGDCGRWSESFEGFGRREIDRRRRDDNGGGFFDPCPPGAGENNNSWIWILLFLLFCNRR